MTFKHTKMKINKVQCFRIYLKQKSKLVYQIQDTM